MSKNERKDSENSSWLSEKFRLVLLDDDTLGEVRSARLSGASILGIIIGALLLTVCIGICLMAFTPLRQLVPGYGDIENNKAYMALSSKIDTLQEELEAQKAVTTGFRRMLNPSEDLMKNISKNDTIIRNSQTNVPKGASLSNDLSLEHHYFWPPIDGIVSAPFDAGSKHFGVDIVAEKDSPVMATLSGVVIGADWNAKTGNTISIQHGQDLVSVYKHNSSLIKNIGEKVAKGDAIAIIGNSGILTSGPHVHFEIWHKGEPIDPEDFMTFKK